MVDTGFTYDAERNERIVRLARARPQGRLRLSPERRAEIERQLEEAQRNRRYIDYSRADKAQAATLHKAMDAALDRALDLDDWRELRERRRAAVT